MILGQPISRTKMIITEIRQLEGPVLADEQVLRFQVPVDKLVAPNVDYCPQDSDDDVKGILIAEEGWFVVPLRLAAAHELLERSFAQYQADRSVVSVVRGLQRGERMMADLAAQLGGTDSAILDYVRLRAQITARERAPLKGLASYEAELTLTLTLTLILTLTLTLILT